MKKFDLLMALPAMVKKYPTVKKRFVFVNAQCRAPAGSSIGGQFAECGGVSSLLSGSDSKILDKALSEIPDTGTRNGLYAKKAIISIKEGNGEINKKNRMQGFIYTKDAKAAAAISFEEDKKQSKTDGLTVYALGSTTKGGGTALIKQVVQESIKRGYKGKISLRTDLTPKTLDFYMDKIKMIPHPTKHSVGSPYLTLPETKVQEVLTLNRGLTLNKEPVFTREPEHQAEVEKFCKIHNIPVWPYRPDIEPDEPYSLMSEEDIKVLFPKDDHDD